MTEKVKHRSLMVKYATDICVETPKEPWKRVLFRSHPSIAWKTCAGHPTWDSDIEYKLVEAFVLVNERPVPHPEVSKPSKGVEYYYPSSTGVEESIWMGHTKDLHRLGNGAVHLEKTAAHTHFKAIFRPTKKHLE